MTKAEIILFFKTYKRGCYTSIIKATQKDGYKKEVYMVCRFVNYYNIKSVKDKGATQSKARPYEEAIIPHILKRNTNTGNLLLCVYTTNRHHAKTAFYYHDEPITEEEYYRGIGEKKRDNQQSVLFNFKADEVVSLGGRKYE